MNEILRMRNKNFRKEELWRFTMNWEETFELRSNRGWIDLNRKSNQCLKCIERGVRIQPEISIDQLYNLNFILGQPLHFFRKMFRNIFSQHVFAISSLFFSVFLFFLYLFHFFSNKALYDWCLKIKLVLM